MADLDQLRSEAESAIRGAHDSAALEELRVRYLGRRSELTATLRSIGELPADQRGPVGKAANEVRVALEELLAERTAGLDASELDLAGTRITTTRFGEADVAHLLNSSRIAVYAGDKDSAIEQLAISAHSCS